MQPPYKLCYSNWSRASISPDMAALPCILAMNFQRHLLLPPRLVDPGGLREIWLFFFHPLLILLGTVLWVGSNVAKGSLWGWQGYMVQLLLHCAGWKMA